MATLQDIQRAGAVTPIGSDSLDYMIHKEWRERELVRLINDRELLVYTYSFIAPGPQPREVFACDHNNRTTDHSLDLDLRPLLENRMTDRTFNNMDQTLQSTKSLKTSTVQAKDSLVTAGSSNTT